MATQGSVAGFDTFNTLNVSYEHAYGENPFKKACIHKVISLLKHGSRVLDIGCGTGVPVSELLSQAGLHVVGFDISPKMIEYAKARVQGQFTVSDMVSYNAEGKFAGVLMVFCHLQLSYKDFHAAAFKFANLVEPNGLFVLGQMPGDTYVKDETEYDETKTYVDDYPAPFMGEMLPTLMLSAEGQRQFLTSMGFEVVWESIDTFQPHSEKCVPEVQQYIIARRNLSGDLELKMPKPLPKNEQQA